MKRKNLLTLNTDNGLVKVTIEGDFKKGTLTADEQKQVMAHMVEKMIPAIADTPFIRSFNQDVKVK
jgi:hypothetical protein